MIRERYESLSLVSLRELAKARGLKGISTLRKPALIERMLEEDAREEQEKSAEVQEEAKKPAEEPVREEEKAQEKGPERTYETNQSRPPIRTYSSYNRSYGGGNRSYGNNGNNENRNYGNNDNRSYGNNENRSYGNNENRNYGNNEGRSYGSNENRSYGNNENRNYGNSENRSYGNNENRNYGNNGNNESRSYGNNAGRSYGSSENQGCSAGETRSYGSDGRVYAVGENQGYDSEDRVQERNQASEMAQLDSGEKANGILEVLPDGYGFIRCENYMPGENDIYVSPSQIRRFNLKTGDILQGNIRIKTQGEKFGALLYVSSINGFHPSVGQKRYNFEDMTPIFPNERLKMERTGGTTAMRIVDLISPIGKGQRGMIVSPPKAGKTTLLKDVAKSILQNNERMHLIILLIDERPEEVTDIKEAIRGENVEVIYSTFDETPEHHKRVSEMVIERARRLVEHKKDVVILLDSITRLARAYNLIIPPSGRTLSGGLDPAALHPPKRFFGAARNMREGGSLTILATALVDTGSKMDDVIYEEFKGTGNMELVLDRKLQEKRVFPAIDIQKSGTRREDLLLSQEEQDAVYMMRKALNGMKSEDAVEQILNMFAHTKDNEEFVQTVKKQKWF